MWLLPIGVLLLIAATTVGRPTVAEPTARCCMFLGLASTIVVLPLDLGATYFLLCAPLSMLFAMHTI